MYKWILSTGWWKGSAPIDADSVFVIGLLCTSLLAGFVYINRYGNALLLNFDALQMLIIDL